MTSSLTVDTEVPTEEARQRIRAATPRRRKLRERISLGHLFMIAAALLAFVLVVSLLQDRSLTVTILVARTDIAPGTVLSTDLVEEIEIPADSDLVGKVATLDTISGGQTSTAQRLSAGDPLTMTALSPAGSTSGRRAMSLPIDRVDAVGGDIAAGDRVDVISVDNDQAVYVAVDLEVLATQAGQRQSGALSGGALSTYFVTVSVDGETALRLALAQNTTDIAVVRSTGAEPLPIEGRTITGAGADGGVADG